MEQGPLCGGGPTCDKIIFHTSEKVFCNMEENVFYDTRAFVCVGDLYVTPQM